MPAVTIKAAPIMVLAENVKRLRLLRGLSQRDLANAVGTSHPRISLIESGESNPTLSTIEKIAEVLQTSVPELLTPVKKLARTA